MGQMTQPTVSTHWRNKCNVMKLLLCQAGLELRWMTIAGIGLLSSYLTCHSAWPAVYG